jgi:hypothetical protein
MKLFIILRRFYRLLIKGLSSGSNSSIYLQEGYHEATPAAASPEGRAAAFGIDTLGGERHRAPSFGGRRSVEHAPARYRFLKYLAMGSWT